MMDSKDDFENLDVHWEHLPKKTREITSFFRLVIDEALESMNEEFVSSYIRCFGKKCHGTIEIAISCELDEIYWRCTSCQKAGVIKNIFGE
ncbi:hypothetical protein [Gaoshiqia sp. Z1-71]|uniref:hypothetical protein n=1 Tax=Gaoshiqia hydrogeniformans TaxID=3290090 RepID=UPI003BF8710A